MKKYLGVFLVITSLFCLQVIHAEPTIESDSAELVAAKTIYDNIRRAYNNNDINSVPVYADFQRLGEVGGRVCTEVFEKDKRNPVFISLHVFSQKYSAQGPLIPARTVEKILVMTNPRLNRDFSKFKMGIEEDYLSSEYTRDDDNFYETRIKKQDNILVFKRKGLNDDNRFVTYGYCYFQ